MSDRPAGFVARDHDLPQAVDSAVAQALDIVGIASGEQRRVLSRASSGISAFATIQAL